VKKIFLTLIIIGFLTSGCIPLLGPSTVSFSTGTPNESETDPDFNSNLIKTQNSGHTQLSRVYNSGSIYIGTKELPEKHAGKTKNVIHDPPEQDASIQPELMMLLETRISQHEGLKLFPYRIAPGRPLHIGYGRNLTAGGISEAEADMMRQRDIREAVQDLKSIFPAWQDIPVDIKVVLVEMRYQLGATGFRGFKNLIEAVQQQNWQRMVFEMYESNWYQNKFTKNIAELLIKDVKNFANKTKGK
jgi:GH24 family phage-related lysozyme (muramidase)